MATDLLRLEFTDQFTEFFYRTITGKRDDLEKVWMFLDDRKGTVPDGSRGT